MPCHNALLLPFVTPHIPLLIHTCTLWFQVSLSQTLAGTHSVDFVFPSTALMWNLLPASCFPPPLTTCSHFIVTLTDVFPPYDLLFAFPVPFVTTALGQWPALGPVARNSKGHGTP